MVRHIALESGLQQLLRELLEQPALAGQLQALGLGPGNELVQKPVIRARRRASASDGVAMFSLVTGAILHDRSYTASFSVSGW